MTDRAIEARALTKRYGDTTAIERIDLAVPSGSVYGFLGPNGAGKTTTMRMLTTLVEPTSGTATVAGVEVTDRASVVPNIGYLPEEPPLHAELTAREQLRYIAGLRDIPDPRAEQRITDLLERFSLGDDADRRISTYSKGMKQKTGIIQAMLHDPDVLFLDEPTSGLDPRAARTVRDTIADLTAGDATVFLSTHILPVVDDLADTVGVLYDGSLVTEGPPDALKQRAEAGDERTLEDVFLTVTGGIDGAA
ncbi:MULTISPECIES: ABC transporter ATP-binding protein [Halobacterium]|uniref:ABC transport protein n=4 Tax=Halobacterium salinarum TaxID=2242 RepID=Q9HNY3_HALSA|nr:MULTISPECIES: ABC transporter ATP-binding protein [Halobacterium]AAG20087.1 ABC transport protein [Halobacterium salinarum NRC-1]MBB6089099.1 ABC-2 type transport system ATP-binding protein [Halobacterium salinarum]MCF2166157.1 ABC transporter ATP-binding protein [Halobacterium salinarum]MCF2167640.1 ABC transporter ATP-binding protein [Halobacterium salinarum]MCF2207317.1 ABC transporter ATP-binding protein [Halobacterium salinarum]